MDLGDVITELAKIQRLGTTQTRDLSPEDRDWFHDHPLRKALRNRGIITSGVVAAAVIEWLEPILEERGEQDCSCSVYVVDYSDPERYHPENLDREPDPACPVHRGGQS